MRKLRLVCRGCGKGFKPEKIPVCDECFSPLDVYYDGIDFQKSYLQLRDKNMWRYFEFLPVEEKRNIVNLGTGYTPLSKANNLSKDYDVELYIKNDTLNPTLSFKDRPAGVAVSKAVEFKDRVVCCVSTGNLAASVSAHAASASLQSLIITPKDIERTKFSQISCCGAKIVTVEGTYDDANRLASVASLELGLNFVNITSRPYYVEGSKTIAFEICEQLGWIVPDYVVIPVASGALLRSVYRGFLEFEQFGLINSIPRIIGAQAEGCSPIVKGYKTGKIVPVEKPETIAKSIAIGDPADGKYAIESVLKTKGTMEAASDKEIVDSIRELGSKEGIFAEPAGAVTLAVVKKLINKGLIERGSTVVCCVTGNGIKTSELVIEDFKPITIKPEIDELRKVIPLGEKQLAFS